MNKEKDYFQEVDALEPGKRRITRLENNKILKSISKKRNGYELNWVSGKISFMKSYKTDIFPKWLAQHGDNIYIQISIRLIPGETAENAPVVGLHGIEVYYRFLKIIVILPEKEEKKESEECEKTEHDVFDSEKRIAETTPWMGSVLYSSQMAYPFYELLKSIGIEKIKSVLTRVTEKKGE